VPSTLTASVSKLTDLDRRPSGDLFGRTPVRFGDVVPFEDVGFPESEQAFAAEVMRAMSSVDIPDK